MFPNLNSDTWTEDDLGMIDDAGDVGGDIQQSDAPERRFALKLDNGQFAVLNFCAYVAKEKTNDDGPPSEPWVQIQVYYAHCTDLEDVGGSEIHGDYRYWDGPGQGMSTVDEARELIANLSQEDLSEATSQMGI